MKTSFVADGDRDFLSLAERQLTFLAYQVTTFRTSTELLNALKQKPTLIIIGELLDGSHAIDLIQAARKALPSTLIFHVARTSAWADAVSSVRAGATEFIEKNSASLVRLRTSLDLLERKELGKTKALLSNIKKVFSK